MDVDDHNCPGPRKPEAAFQFRGFLNRSRREEPKQPAVSSSSKWDTSFLKAAEAGMARLSSEFNQVLGRDGEGLSSSSHGGSASGQVEQCPQCNLRFSTVGALVDHVEKVHNRDGVMKVTVDVCP
ncbi:zinc finger AN1 and C2H2 domain-containing stress-associated 16 [Olea europaea subsp. europaea]|uniref:Zinc finger AN1 and C2H2 domain-containing stress-associated 16 n=1 Tax=Olea europaea subsp. europaea TaxID=158383 RepID=A0A8S0TZU2_OLEEU|nr:zinc finger AN1 and C2H2 domain-containing stress-associated 16 [Olea europaea subsp. europaea]